MRLVTYNIQNWHDENKNYSWKMIAETLEELDADIIVLNEVNSRRGQLLRLARYLNMYYIFHPIESISFGDAILSKNKILSKKTFKLSECRGVIVAKIENVHFLVCGTHLDHESEKERYNQVKIMFEQFDKTNIEMNNVVKKISEVPHVIMGDCNTLRYTDYTEEQWNEIEQERVKNRWEIPCQGIVSILDERYHDAYLQTEKEIDNPSYFMTAHTLNLKYRIDYCWLSKNMLEMYRIIEHRAVQEAKGSDHVPVLTVLTKMLRWKVDTDEVNTE